MTPEEYLTVPYVLSMESIQGPDGRWIRRARYPELPGCVADGSTPIDAIDKLEEARVRLILERLDRGESIPVPRAPLRSAYPEARPKLVGGNGRH